VRLGLHNKNLSPWVTGGRIVLADIHAKIRRDGYRANRMPLTTGHSPSSFSRP
jgi:hypothetical protein